MDVDHSIVPSSSVCLPIPFCPYSILSSFHSIFIPFCLRSVLSLFCSVLSPFRSILSLFHFVLFNSILFCFVPIPFRPRFVSFRFRFVPSLFCFVLFHSISSDVHHFFVRRLSPFRLTSVTISSDVRCSSIHRHPSIDVCPLMSVSRHSSLSPFVDVHPC